MMANPGLAIPAGVLLIADQREVDAVRRKADDAPERATRAILATQECLKIFEEMAAKIQQFADSLAPISPPIEDQQT